MHREAVLQLLEQHDPFDAHEEKARERIVAFVRQYRDCFERHLAVGHITASAWVLNPKGTHVLLTHHRKLDKWLQLGGHADGDPDVLRVAVREAQEESGIDDIEPIHEAIFDVDVHPIPARGRTPEHLHYDIRFLLRVTRDVPFQVSDESHELAWVTPEGISKLDTDSSVRRMARKWTQITVP